MTEEEYLFREIRRFLLCARTEITEDRNRCLADAEKNIEELENLVITPPPGAAGSVWACRPKYFT